MDFRKLRLYFPGGVPTGVQGDDQVIQPVNRRWRFLTI